MKKCSLPTQMKDGAIIIRPLCSPESAPCTASSHHRPMTDFNSPSGGGRIDRAGILRDITVLVALATTILSGSAVLIMMLWREVSLALAEARIVEAKLAAEVRMAELEVLANQQVAAGSNPLLLVLFGLGVLLVVAAFLRPTIILGR